MAGVQVGAEAVVRHIAQRALDMIASLAGDAPAGSAQDPHPIPSLSFNLDRAMLRGPSSWGFRAGGIDQLHF